MRNAEKILNLNHLFEIKHGKCLRVGVWVGALGALLPFLCLCAYNHPLGIHEWDWISNHAGELDHLSFWEQQAYWYNSTMGRFASTALLSLTHYWYSLPRFQAFFAGMLLFFMVSLLFFFRKIVPATSGSWSALPAMGLLWAYLFNLSDIYDSIYRFSGVLTYQIGLIGVLFCSGWLVQLLREGFRPFAFIGLIISGLLAIGSNEITLVLLALVFACVLFYWVMDRQKLPLWFWVAGCILGAGAAAALLAPGNFARMNEYGAALGMGKFIFLTVASSGFLYVKWLGQGLLLPLLFLYFPLGIYWREKWGKTALFASPGRWFWPTILSIPLCLAPMIWSARGATFPERVVDLLYVPFAIGAFGFVQACINKHPDYFHWVKKMPALVFGILLVVLIGNTFFGGLEIDRNHKNYSNYLELLQVDAQPGQALKCLLDGTAKRYDAEVKMQYELVAAATQDSCFVPRPAVFPKPLYDSLSDRRHEIGEMFMGKVLGKQQVKMVFYSR